MKLLPQVLAFLLLAPAQASVWSWFNQNLNALDNQQRDLRKQLDSLPPAPSPQALEQVGFHSGLANQESASRWVQVDLGKEYPLDSVVVVPAYFRAGVYGWPPRFRVDASTQHDFGESVTLLDHVHSDSEPAMLPHVIAAHGVKARYVRFTATRMVLQPRLKSTFFFCLGELLVFSGKRNVALHCAVEGPGAVETPPTWSPRHLVDGWSAFGLPVLPDNERTNGWHSAISPNPDDTEWVQVDLGALEQFQEIRLIPAHPSDFPDRFGFGFPPRFKVEASDDATFAHPITVFDATQKDCRNPGDNIVAFAVPDITARYVRVTATRLFERTRDYVFALSELEVISGGTNIARNKGVTSLNEVKNVNWNGPNLVDGRASSGVLVPQDLWLSQLSQRRTLEAQLQVTGIARQEAIALAQTRAMEFGGAGFGLLALLAALAAWRGRQSRKREIEDLRQRISRDLHDEIGSHLGSITLMSELALRAPQPDENRETMEEIHRLSREAAESMRGIIWLVREKGEPSLEQLEETIRQSAGALLQGLEWEFQPSPNDPPVKASLELHRHLFLFAKEALHNIARHAHAKQARIAMSWNAHRLHLQIDDDGCGFDSNAPSSGSGLSNLKHRAASLHGNLDIHSQPSQGTRITLDVPLV